MMQGFSSAELRGFFGADLNPDVPAEKPKEKTKKKKESDLPDAPAAFNRGVERHFMKRFDCVIESSANLDTNPRIEQTTITVSTELARFYKEFFDGITPFNREVCGGFSPYEI